MSTDVWFRNPHLYIKEALELGVSNYVWDHGFIKKKGINVNKFMDLYVGSSRKWKALVVSMHAGVMFDESSSMENPIAVVPVWKYGESFELLEEIVTNQTTKRRKGVPDEFQYLNGQPHWVVISYLPPLTSTNGKRFMVYLSNLQNENPHCIIHIHGAYSYRWIFGLDFMSVDMECRTNAAKNKVVLPNGRYLIMGTEEVELWEDWIKLLGTNIKTLEDSPRERCLFNIKSALWCGENYKEQVKFRVKGFENADIDGLLNSSQGPETNRIFLKHIKPLPDDKFFCSVCSLQNSCRYFREGAVCVVPDSEPAQLAGFFKTRDSHAILEGMSQLLNIEAKRFEAARQNEIEKERLDPEVTKMLDKMFGHAEKFAKLVDPSLRATSTTNNNSTNQTLVLNAGSTQELAANVMRILIAQGVPANEITSDMVMGIIQSPGDNLEQKAIDASAGFRALGP